MEEKDNFSKDFSGDFAGKVLRALWITLGVLYFPVYAAGWLMHMVARSVLALSYLLMLDGRKALDIMRSLARKP